MAGAGAASGALVAANISSGPLSCSGNSPAPAGREQHHRHRPVLDAGLTGTPSRVTQVPGPASRAPARRLA
jgi:hypothetical protein